MGQAFKPAPSFKTPEEKTMPKSKPAHITRKEAAELLQVSERTIDRLIRRGTLHTVKPAIVRGQGGARILIARADVDKLLAAEGK
jgi:excisionase family DNA binding protein